ncbi:MAG: YggT family protein [Clostridiales Family XIII bacterium]|jgi:YggT family protein|nr:YggT family protein [Clostridiales Family XIII bacterium]
MYILIIAIDLIAKILIWILVIRAVLSWFVNPYSRFRSNFIVKLYIFLGQVSEPIVAPFRKLLSRFNTGPIDFSLLLTMMAIMILQNVLIRVLSVFV